MLNNRNEEKYIYWKRFGVCWLAIEMSLMSGTVFGFNSIFPILSRYGIYQKNCIQITNNQTNSLLQTHQDCYQQIKKYQDAVTIGLIFFNILTIFIGILIDYFGPRLIKLISLIFHILGWLALALANSERDYYIFVHTILTSISGCTILVTTYTSTAYFSQSRALISTIFTGAGILSSMWFAIFQILINANLLSLSQLSYIWSSFGFLLFLSSFLFLDWKYSFGKLPYQFDIQQEQTIIQTKEKINCPKIKWYQQIIKRQGIWKYLTSPLYLMIVLYVSTLLIVTDLLSITWYPTVFYLTNQNTPLADKYTNIYNFSILSGIVICPIAGYFLGYKAHQNRKRKMLNILILQMLTWLLTLFICILCIIIKRSLIIPLIILNSLTRSLISSGPQAIVATYFPSKHLGTLTGLMWTMVGLVTFIQYLLVPLTQDVKKSWRAWLIVFGLMLIMLSHLIQLFGIYLKEKRKRILVKQSIKINVLPISYQNPIDLQISNDEQFITKF